MTSIASTSVRPAQPAEEDSIPERIGREVARRVGARRWDMWFDRTTDFVVEDGSLRIRADSRFVADWIERHFREAIQTAARAELGDAAKVSLEVRHRPGEDATSHDGTEGRNQDGPHAAPPDRSPARNPKRLRRYRRDVSRSRC